MEKDKRTEVASLAMAALLVNQGTTNSPTFIAMKAVEYTDALFKELEEDA